MKAREIRERYLKFFEKRGHSVIPSSSLIPEGDSTLLFVNSGMFPLVPYLLGEKHPGGVRLCDSQKSFRAEDIEEVGDNRHNTFFEMLGNWSLGDYFKKEQLNWWYEFLVEDLKLDPRKLYQTVYAGSEVAPKDEESVAILKEIFAKYGIVATEGPATTGKGSLGPGIAVDFFGIGRIFAYRDKNWWQRGDAVGELGGPDSETFYDTGKQHNPKFGERCHVNCDCGRFIEIGNSVFMQYRMTEQGWSAMERKNVDFGGGLERIAMVMQEKDNIFETDLFSPMLEKLAELSGKRYREHMREFEIVTDHIKAASFILGDDKGVVPSNLGQGYIVRRLVRRALRYGSQLGIQKKNWIHTVAESVISIYEKQYPELARNKQIILDELSKEEGRFAAALERGMREFSRFFAVMQTEENSRALSGKQAFDLYQTYGFPIEMTQELAKERGYEVDMKEFNHELERHQELSRTASAGMFKGGLADHSTETTKLHTATHLLLAALRKVLGLHVYQKGSNITSERLRLDVPHPAKMTAEEIATVEQLVNQAIKDDLPVSWNEMTVLQAKAKGAVGVFEERYGERVKVYEIGREGEAPFSVEICGGPHVARTSELGEFHIDKEEAVAAGVRRIRATLTENPKIQISNVK